MVLISICDTGSRYTVGRIEEDVKRGMSRKSYVVVLIITILSVFSNIVRR